MLLDEVAGEAPDEDAVLLLREKRHCIAVNDEAVLTGELTDGEQTTRTTVAHHHDPVMGPDEVKNLSLADATGYNGGVWEVLIGDVEEPRRLVSRVDDERLGRVVLGHTSIISTPRLSSSGLYSPSTQGLLLLGHEAECRVHLYVHVVSFH